MRSSLRPNAPCGPDPGGSADSMLWPNTEGEICEAQESSEGAFTFLIFSCSELTAKLTLFWIYLALRVNLREL